MANSVDPDETARYEPSHQGLHCLHMSLFWSVMLKVLSGLVILIDASFKKMTYFVTSCLLSGELCPIRTRF